MLIQEIIEDYTTLVKTYSDKGLKIRKVGTDEIYDEAIDPQEFHREYEETDMPIDEVIEDFNIEENSNED